MPPIAKESPYILLALAGLSFLIVGAIAAALLPLPLAIISAELLCLLIPALMFRRAFDPPQGGWPALRPAQPWWWVALACAGAAALGMSINALAAGLTHLSPALAAQSVEYAAKTRAMLHPEATWLMIAAHLSVIVFAPLTEECLFRAAMLPAQRAFMRPALACAVNGLLFGAFHFNLLVLLPLAILGAYLAWLTLTARSYTPALLGHATMNGLSAAMIPHQIDAPPAHTLPLVEIIAPGAAAASIAAGLIFVLYRTAR